MAKKTWQTPKLVVMLRTNPEENVLTGCKVDSGAKTSVANKSTPLCYCYKNGKPAYGVATS